MKGGVVQLSSLSSQSVRRLSPGSEVLQCSSWVAGPLPTTALLSSHLATSGLPARVLERNFYTETSICLNNNTRLRLEMRAGASSPPELTPVCFVKTSTFQPDQLWARTSLAWSKLPDDLQLATLLSVLRHSGRCLLLEVGQPETEELLLMFKFRIRRVWLWSCSTTRTQPPPWDS